MGTVVANSIELSSANKENSIVQSPEELDAGALFVLKSRGSWLHCGYHLTTSIVGPVIFSFPFALSLLGWVPGLLITAVQAMVTFYSYNLLSVVLEHHAQFGKRQLRFRDMARDILGPKWGKFFVGPLQFAICYGAVIACILLGGQSLKFIYLLYNESGKMQLYQFITIFGAVPLFLAQMPSFHSLRHINFASLLLVLAYSACITAGSIRIGNSRNAPRKDYSIKGSEENRILGAINGISIIATTYGCGIIPEIQATIAPPVKGKMFKGLCICFGVILSTYFSVAISGYWAFGNQSKPTILYNFMGEDKPLLPIWFLLVINIFTLMQLVAVTVIYLQPTNEIFEKWFANPKMDQFSARNVMPRLCFRSLTVIFATLIAAMLPFFGDIMALFGAFGIIPLDFILPMVLYNVTFKPSKKGIIFWGNTLIAVASSTIVVMGAVASVRQIILDAKTYSLFANM
ncbi:Amino acid transporter, transmembrane [Corchorus olitorius]|uniref:Amino acid transporter, transmembrane n=1 Tax=Corchorus olitorius TaxID=93759 RepID=A0A1R3GND9_9ROSI|nr:Amino acid transporter, transmembrane [Corchorus olitorius]